jgi:uncharacterized protein (TIGR02246 family)
MIAMSGAAWAKGESKAQKQVSELKQFRDNFQMAWNQRNFAAIRDMYSENAVSVDPEGQRAVGRNQILLNEQQMQTKGPFRGTTSNFRIESIRPLTKDLALVTVNQQIAGLRDPSIPSEYEIVSVLEKEHGDWKIVDSRAFPSREAQAVGGAGPSQPSEHQCPGMGGAGQQGAEPEIQISPAPEQESLPEGLQQPQQQ